MARGSFNGLYTFDQVAKIYNIDSSTLRKMVQANKFSDKDIKKFGKTWIITEDAIDKHFGLQILRAYETDEQLRTLKELREAKLQAKLNKKASKPKKIKNNNDVNDLGGNDEEVSELGYIAVDPSLVKQSFNFSK